MVRGIRKIGIIGGGTMGSGIAQVFSMYGYNAVLIDKDASALKKALSKIKKYTAPQELDEVMSKIKTSVSMDSVSDCQLIIEAVYEDLGLKKEILRNLSLVAKTSAIIATNTSSISINELSKSVLDPSRFIGMHFMNPPKVMKMLEVIKGDETSDKTVKTALRIAKDLEKIPALVNDSPGFVSNRLLFALIGEAIRVLEAGISSREDIDNVMKYGMSYPMGPIELADFIGLDVCYDIMLYLYEQLGDKKFLPPFLLKSLVREGKLGRKTKEGFYNYR